MQYYSASLKNDVILQRIIKNNATLQRVISVRSQNFAKYSDLADGGGGCA
jgi:hypothetical protein